MLDSALCRRALLGAGAAAAISVPLACAARPASGTAIGEMIGKLVSDGTIAGASWCVASIDTMLAEGMAGWMDKPNQRPMRARSHQLLVGLADQTGGRGDDPDAD